MDVWRTRLIEDEIIEKQRKQYAVTKVRANMTSKQRVYATKRLVDGMSWAEIGRIEGKTRANVRQTARLGISNLKQRVINYREY